MEFESLTCQMYSEAKITFFYTRNGKYFVRSKCMKCVVVFTVNVTEYYSC